MSTVTITREFDSPPDAVFDAWTKPAEIAAWYGPAHVEAPAERITVDLRVGGRWELTMVRRDGAGEHPIGYTILELDPPHLLVMASDPMPQMVEPVVVRLELEATAAGTRLTLTDGPYPEGWGDGAQAGYVAALDKLAAALAA